MKETLIMKHAVGGRIFIDTSKQLLPYTLEQTGDIWKFTVQTQLNEAITELLKVKDELNVFIFREVADQPIVKTWYYVNDGPVVFEADVQCLTVYAQSRIEYIPDAFQN